MVIGPDDGDEQIAHRVAEPCGPERQQGREGRVLRWTQLQNQDCDEDSEHAVGEQVTRSGVARWSMVVPFLCVAGGSPGGAKRNPGSSSHGEAAPGCASLHPGHRGWPICEMICYIRP